MSVTLQFAVPPSLGALKAATLAVHLGAWLRRLFRGELDFRMRVATSYAELSALLLGGQVDLAWAPPMVCASVERAGGAVLAQCERGGATTFRAAFVGRSGSGLKLDALDGVSVAWVARESTAGYQLPRAWLASQGVNLARAFQREHFSGSYHLSLVALVSRRVELATTFASPAHVAGGSTGLDRVPDALRAGLEVLGFTDEVANDAIVAGAQVSRELVAQVRDGLLAATDAEPLEAIFGAERLVAATPGAWRLLEPAHAEP